MKRFTTALSVFILLSVCGACTVTKQHFGSGYHVEWKRGLSEKTRKESGSTKNLTGEPDKLLDEVIMGSQEERDSTLIIADVSGCEVKSDSLAAADPSREKSGKRPLKQSIKTLKATLQLTSSKQESKNALKPEKSKSPQVDVLTWIALGILSLLLTAALILLLLKMLTNPIAFFYFLALAIVSLILSAISLKRVFNSPDDYSGKGITIAVFVVSLLLSLGLIFYGIHLFIQSILNLW